MNKIGRMMKTIRILSIIRLRFKIGCCSRGVVFPPLLLSYFMFGVHNCLRSYQIKGDHRANIYHSTTHCQQLYIYVVQNNNIFSLLLSNFMFEVPIYLRLYFFFSLCCDREAV